VLAAAPTAPSTDYLSPSWAPRMGAIGDSEVETRGVLRHHGGGAPAREHLQRRSGARASTTACQARDVRGGAPVGEMVLTERRNEVGDERW
jgi:hypothetical protein